MHVASRKFYSLAISLLGALSLAPVASSQMVRSRLRFT